MLHQRQLTDWESAKKETNERLGYKLGDYPGVAGLYWGFCGVLAMMGALFVADLLTLFEHSRYFPSGEAFYTRVAVFFAIIGGCRAWIRNRKWENTNAEILARQKRQKELE